MAQTLISRCATNLERPIGAHLREIIQKDNESGDTQYERGEQLQIIYELSILAPQILVSVSALFQDMLEVEEEKLRLENVELFGKIFTDEKSTLAEKYPQVFFFFYFFFFCV